MSITKKQLKDFEDKEKKELYQAISEMISEQAESIELLSDIGQFFRFDTNISNIGITFNNKISELSQEFEQAGISMYADVNERYEYIDTNMVGDAIILDLANQVGKALIEYGKYEEMVGELANKKGDEIQAFNTAGPIKKFFYRAKNLFISDNKIIQKLLIVPQKEMEEINSYIAKYREFDDKVFRYNLKDNIRESIVEYIKEIKKDKELIPRIIEENIAPTLKKLGMGNLISEIEKELKPEKKKSPIESKKSWEMSNWGVDVEYIREEAAKASKGSQKTKKNTIKELSERE